jgi:hypothetical protein
MTLKGKKKEKENYCIWVTSISWKKLSSYERVSRTRGASDTVGSDEVTTERAGVAVKLQTCSQVAGFNLSAVFDCPG